MFATARGAAREFGIRLLQPLREARDEIGQEKRRVDGDAGDKGAVRTLSGDPIEAGQHAGDVRVEFAHRPVDPFFNASRPEDFAAAAAPLQAAGG